MNTKSKIHIAIAFDQNYLNPFYALVTSVLLNNQLNQLSFHIILTGITDEEKQKIQSYIEQSGATISFYTIDETLVGKFVLVNKWTATVYYRLFFPYLIPVNIERLLYIDTDTIVVNDLLNLYEIELESYSLGAVPDNYVKVQPMLDIHEDGEYFNSGVLLIDIKKWKQLRVTEQAIDYLMQYPERILFVDQCALNAILFKNWKKLPKKYNLLYSYVPEGMSRSEIKKFLTDKTIVHYTLQRPWNMLSKNRLGYLYHYYLRKSPLYKGFISYTDFSIGKILPFLKLKFIDAYLDSPFLVKVVRRIKKDIAN